MRRGAFGTVILIVVVAIVLVLAARNWSSLKQAAPAVKSGDVKGLPGMERMKEATGRHTNAVEEALEGSDASAESDQ
jgi:hypothetical protein